MNLPYKQFFPWQEPTHFMEKIITGHILATTKEEIVLKPMHWRPKIHTIREDAGDRWVRDMHPDGVGTLLRIHHCYGLRSKDYKCFLINDCTGTQTFEIKYLIRDEHYNSYFDNAPVIEELDRYRTALNRYRTRYLKRHPSHFDVVVYVDDLQLSAAECEVLAVNDGFKDFTQFKRWFKDDFSGKIVHWTDFRYGNAERELKARQFHNSAGLDQLSAADIENLAKLLPLEPLQIHGSESNSSL